MSVRRSIVTRDKCDTKTPRRCRPVTAVAVPPRLAVGQSPVERVPVGVDGGSEPGIVGPDAELELESAVRWPGVLVPAANRRPGEGPTVGAGRLERLGQLGFRATRQVDGRKRVEDDRKGVLRAPCEEIREQ